MIAGSTLAAIGEHPDDEALVAAAQQGDRVAMDALLRRHQARLWAICRRLTGNDADAADALQEAMLLIVRKIGAFDGRSRFTTWAHRVTTNACLDELRRRRRRPAPGLADDDEDTHTAVVDTAPAIDGSVTDRLTIDEALAQLPEEFRSPLVLRDLTGHDYAEIGEILGIPAGTVRSRIARGRRRLAELLTVEDGSTSGTIDPGRPDTESTSRGNQPAPTDRPTTQP